MKMPRPRKQRWLGEELICSVVMQAPRTEMPDLSPIVSTQNTDDAPELLSLDEIADRMGIQVDRVRQIEELALRKLRRGLKELGIKSAGDLRDED